MFSISIPNSTPLSRLPRGGLGAPWTYLRYHPIPIDPPPTPIFDQVSLSKSFSCGFPLCSGLRVWMLDVRRAARPTSPTGIRFVSSRGRIAWRQTDGARIQTALPPRGHLGRRSEAHPGKKLPLGAAGFHALRDTAGRTLFPLPIKWIAARVRIGPSMGAKSVLHRWVHGQNKTTAVQAKACAQLEFESTVFRSNRING